MNLKKIIFGSLSILMVTMAVTTTHAETFNRNLSVGSRGTDVSTLQTFLAQDSTIYPQGLVTGYFGFLTKSAVSNFQSRGGLSADGIVGPITLRALNAQFNGGISSSSLDAPLISGVYVSPSRNSAVVNWSTNESAKGLVYYNNTPLTFSEGFNYVTVSGSTAMTDTSSHTSQSVNIQSLQPNTTYYYLIHVTDQNGNISVTWPTTFVTTQ